MSLFTFGRWLRQHVLPSPVRGGHVEPSALISAADIGSQPDDRLVELGIAAAEAARKVDLKHVTAREKRPLPYTTIWPGEHYHYLAGLVRVLQPKVVVELGTFEGLSALAMKTTLPPDGVIHTFDIVPWNSIASTALRAEDFDAQLRQHVDDLTNDAAADKHADLLRSADLIFVDVAHTGEMEMALWRMFERIGLKKGCIIGCDDTRLWAMLPFWQSIREPKLDVTSFAHWSGTGIVHWTRG